MPDGCSRFVTDGVDEHLVRTVCGRRTAMAAMPSICPRCDDIIDARFPEKPDTGPDGVESEGLRCWQRWLPACPPEHRITLGEGRSPLLACHRLAETLGLGAFWVKNDALMPTGSFKDRAVALAISLAHYYGRPGIVLSSSGNAGASAAAYAARAGMPAVVFVPETAPKNKLTQILVHGARLVTVKGGTSDCCRLARLASARFGWVNLTTTYYNPYGVDAYATIAYEMAAVRPDCVLLPISSGPLLAGVMKGFVRLQAHGLLDRMPRPVAVQSACCAPIVRAFAMNQPVTAWPAQDTIASALNDILAGYERDGDLRWPGFGASTAQPLRSLMRRSAPARRGREFFWSRVPRCRSPRYPSFLRRGDLRETARVVAVTTGNTGNSLKDVRTAAVPDLPAAIGVHETEIARNFG